ncbi:MAG: fibronectin type III domain-containing protein [Nanoarchaeota archaeon]
MMLKKKLIYGLIILISVASVFASWPFRITGFVAFDTLSNETGMNISVTKDSQASTIPSNDVQSSNEADIPQEEVPYEKSIVKFKNNHVSKIEFDSVKKDTISKLKMKDIKELKDKRIKSVKTFAIDPTAVNFTTATVTVPNAVGNKLMKCKDWDYTAEVCNGEWSELKSITPGKEYTVELTPEDPAFAEIIEITKASHLDSNRQFISDIYPQVSQQDDVWSETIPNKDYVRVTFEKELTSSNDITIYPRIVSGKPKIEIYETDGSTLVAEFTSLNENEYNKVYLTNLIGEQDTFDLRISGGSVEFDYILDPSPGLSQGGTVGFFSEGFESGTFTTNRWTNTSTVAVTYRWTASTTTPLTGTYSARSPTTNPMKSTMILNLSTVGWKNITLSWKWSTSASALTINASYWKASTSSWVLMRTLPASKVETTFVFNKTAVSVENVTAPYFRIMFTCVATGTSNRVCYVDDVNVTGNIPYLPAIKLQTNRTTATTAVINWTTNMPSNATIRWGTTASVAGMTGKKDVNFTTLGHNITISGLSGGTKYFYNITSSYYSNRQVNGTYKLLTTAMTVSAITALNKSNIRQSTIKINWTTDQNSNTTIKYGTTASVSGLSNLRAVQNSVTAHNMTLFNLKAGTQYFYNLTSCNSVGCKTNNTPSYSFTTRSNVTISTKVQHSTTNQTTSINWTTNVASNTTVRYGTAVSLGTKRHIENSVTAHNVTLRVMTPGIKYFYNISSCYLDSCKSNNSYSFAFKNNTKISASTNTTRQGTAVINWTTNVNTNTSVKYGITASVAGLSTLRASQFQTATHNITLTGLKAGTKYFYNITSCDTNTGQCKINGTFKILTKSNVTISSSKNTTRQSTAVINWTTSQLGNTSIRYGKTKSLTLTRTIPNSVTAHNVTLTGLVAGTKYFYNITSGYLDSIALNGSFALITKSNVSISASTNTTRQSSAVINWTTNVASNTSVRYGTTKSLTLTRTIPNSVTVHNVTLTGLKAGTIYYYNITSGNLDSIALNGSFVFVTKSNVTISSSKNTTRQSTAVINWTTSQLGNTSIRYGKTKSLTLTRTIPNSVTAHNVTLTGLVAGTKYFYNITSGYLDSIALNGSFALITKSNVSISAVNKSGQTTSSTIINWTTNLASNTSVRYGKTNDVAGMTNVRQIQNSVTNHNVTLTGLRAGQIYYFNVSSTYLDSVQVNGSYSFTTITNMSISQINKSGQSQTSVVINWTTNLAGNTSVKYGTTASVAGLSTTRPIQNSVTAHNVTLTGLDPATQYFFNVSSCTLANNCQVNGSKSFWTKSATTCNCPGLNNAWEIDMTENCNIVSDCNIGTGTLSFINTGSMRCGAAITTLQSLGTLANGQTIWMDAACLLKTGP